MCDGKVPSADVGILFAMALDHEIARTESEIEAMRPRMQQACDHWLEVVAAWGGSFFLETARDVFVTREPGFAKAMPPDESRRFRGSVNQLTANAKQLAAETIIEANAHLWPHTFEDMSVRPPDMPGGAGPRFSYFRSHDAKPPPVVVELTRTYLNLVIDVLHEFGFRGQGGYRFMAYHHKWSNNMLLAMRAYGQLDSVLIELQDQLAALRRQKEQGEAAALWDAA
ncbi:MAG TPA: hypothetical protein VF520_01670 [Thermoleophilaceae bacterium]